MAKALTQMEHVTQNTAASAEQNAAAGQELNAQSQALMAVVEQLQALVGRASRLIGSLSGATSPAPSIRARLLPTGWGRLEVLGPRGQEVLPDQFNKPAAAKRIVAAYDTFSNVWHGASFEAYALDHSQNKIGGWTGACRSRDAELWRPGVRAAAGQVRLQPGGSGRDRPWGLLTQRAYAWFAGGSRKVNVGRAAAEFAEYKLASG